MRVNLIGILLKILNRSEKNDNVEQYTLDYLRPYINVLEVETNSTTEKYIYGLDLISQKDDNNSKYYYQDILNSTVATEDKNGNLTTIEYGTFGDIEKVNGLDFDIENPSEKLKEKLPRFTYTYNRKKSDTTIREWFFLKGKILRL